MTKLKAPFPWFGGKRQIAKMFWETVGPMPKNYVEPFAGSLAVLLANPYEDEMVEVINDLDGYVTNAWRAIQHDPATVLQHVDWPVSELDLHARSTYCETIRADLTAKMRSNPHYFDAKLAGWWIWGLSTGIGDTFIAQKKAIPRMQGIGVHRKSFQGLQELEALSRRLRKVKIACGDWSRVVKPSIYGKNTPCLYYLDPPYARKERHDTYAEESYQVAEKVEKWCIENEDNPNLWIVLSGYEGDYTLTNKWRCISWEAQGGYASLGTNQGTHNKTLERLWLSPSIPQPQNLLSLFM